MSELKECPFCGAAAMLHPVARDWWRIIVHHEEDCIMGDDNAPTAPQTPEQMELLVAAWNRRATPAGHISQARDAVLEECAKVLDRRINGWRDRRTVILNGGIVAHELEHHAHAIRALKSQRSGNGESS